MSKKYERRIAIRGSEREPVHGARAIGPADPGERVGVSVYLKAGSAESAHAKENGTGAGISTRVSRTEFAQARGADPADIRRIEQFAHDHGLTVLEASVPAARTR